MKAIILVIVVVLAIACDPTKASPANRVRRQWTWGGGSRSTRQTAATPAPTPAPTAAPTAAPTTPNVNSREYIACFRSCPSTMEYNPVCATNNITYDNLNRLNCANRCGLNIAEAFRGTCQPL